MTIKKAGDGNRLRFLIDALARDVSRAFQCDAMQHGRATHVNTITRTLAYTHTLRHFKWFCS